MTFLLLSLILGVFLLVLVSSMVSTAMGPYDDILRPLFLIASLFISGVWVGMTMSDLTKDHATAVEVSKESTSKEGQ